MADPAEEDDWAPVGDAPAASEDDWTPVAEPPSPASLGQVMRGQLSEAGQILGNVPRSAYEVGKNIVGAVAHPIETATNLKNVGLGALEHLGVPGEEHKKYADAVGEFFKNRYGSWEKAQNTFREDPVGFLMDASSVLGAGGGLVSRMPGMVGQVGDVASAVGRAADPLRAVGKAAQLGATGASEILGGITTHAGGPALRLGAEAGYKGGEAAESFLENLRATAPTEGAVNEARSALGSMLQKRGAAYNKEMADLGLDKTVLNFDKVDDALVSASQKRMYKGQDLSPKTSEVRMEMAQTIADWKKLNPSEYHTPEGLDALKKKLGNIYEATEPRTPERVVAREIYNGVRQTIVDQSPKYAPIMKAWEDSEKIIGDMEKTLSLSPNASVDTSLRKLQSVLRDNVNTSYGHRKELAQVLVNAGAKNLLYKLAGQALQPVLPRGLGRLGAQIGLEIHALNPALWKALLAAPFASPRLMGETAYYAGKGARAAERGVTPAHAAFQSGRIDQLGQQATGGRIRNIRNRTRSMIRD